MGWLSRIFLGTDVEADQRRADQLDQQLRDLNSKDYAPGGRIYRQLAEDYGETYAEQVWAEVQRNLDRQDQQDADIEGQVSDAFRSGWNDAWDERTGQFRAAAAAPFRFAAASIPWQLWLLAAAALFWWMGGLNLLRGRLAK